MLLAFALLLLDPSDEQTSTSRDSVTTGVRQMLDVNDRDHDGRLSLAEWTAMVDAVFPLSPRPNQASSDHDEMRRSSLDMRRFEDANADGFLSLEELLRRPLENFDCMDSNHDRVVTQAETWRGMDQCPSITWSPSGWSVVPPMSPPSGRTVPSH